MRQTLPEIFAVERDKPNPDMPAIVAEAVAAGLSVQLIVPREKRWKITRKDGVAFFYWPSTGRWFSSNQNLRLNGFDQEGLRNWLGIERKAT